MVFGTSAATISGVSTSIQLRAEGGTVWLTQADIADLFDTTPQNITQHTTKAIFAEGELTEAATCKELLQVRQEGTRAVNRTLKHYNLDKRLGMFTSARPPETPRLVAWPWRMRGADILGTQFK